MIPLINKMKRKDGFTLVELIVVLVILAILAAFTIPAMLGYINDAREKAGLSEARASLLAAQATINSVYGPMSTTDRATALSNNALPEALTGTIDETGDLPENTDIKPTISASDVADTFNQYASGDLTEGAEISDVSINDNGKITDYTYALTDFTYTYNGSDWTISDTVTASDDD